MHLSIPQDGFQPIPISCFRVFILSFFRHKTELFLNPWATNEERRRTKARLRAITSSHFHNLLLSHFRLSMLFGNMVDAFLSKERDKSR